MEILDKQLIKSIKWLINIRWIGILSLLAILFIAKSVSSFVFSSQPILILGAIAWLYNIFFFIDIKKREKRKEDRLQHVPILQRIANIQIDLDLLILIGFIHFSGGIESPLILFLLFHMITTGMLLPVGSGLAQATLTILLYCSLIAVEYMEFIPHVCVLGENFCDRQNLSYAFSKIILLSGTLYLTLALSAFLGKKLKNQERQLYYMYRKMKSMAMMDELTQVYNYRYFRQQLSAEIERADRYDRKLALLLIDVDNLKKFNDKYGHLTGSESLKTVAKILRGGTRFSDSVAKYGGDEFVIIAPETDEEQAKNMAERLRRDVEKQPFPAGIEDQNGNPLHELTISIGIACYPEHAINEETLIEAADRGAYKAKALGKNRTCLYDGERIEALS